MGSTTTQRTGLRHLLEGTVGATTASSTARYDVTSCPTGGRASSGHAGVWTVRTGALPVGVDPRPVDAGRLNSGAVAGIPALGAPASFRSCGTTVPGSARHPAP